MSEQSHAAPAPVGGRLLTPATFVLGVLVAVALALIVVRLFAGLGGVTNLNDGYPWGIWIAVDVVIGSAFACGGFSVAMLVYIFNRGHYHPLVRPALLASLFGYTLAGAGVMIDLGRWWNVWNMFWPWSVNPNSVMFEVAVCITAYIVVMWIEFAPTFLEHFGLTRAKRALSRAMYFIVALGTVLPMMHQSSLGSLLVVMGTQIHPLWQTMMLPLLFLLSAIGIGYAVVLFESCIAAAGYRRSIETHLLTPLSKIMLGMLAAFLVVRFGDLIWRGALGHAFAPTLQAIMFWLETACFVAPFLVLRTAAQRRNPGRLFVGGVTFMLGGILLRINAFLIGYDTGEGWTYFPSVSELLVTIGMFSIEALGYIVITRRFPVLPREERIAAPATTEEVPA